MRLPGEMDGSRKRGRHVQGRVGMAYRDTDKGGRKVYCPVCLKHRGSDGHAVITMYRKLGITRKSIGRDLVTKGHIRALDEEQKEATQKERRRQVGMRIARIALQTLREGTVTCNSKASCFH